MWGGSGDSGAEGEGGGAGTWGTLEEGGAQDEALLHNVNFNPIIELAMQNIPEIPISVKSRPVELPPRNTFTHTVALHEHEAQLAGILERTEAALLEGKRVEAVALPSPPDPPPDTTEHRFRSPINYLDKEYCDFSLGKGPTVLPLNPESHQRALRQCTALALAHIGIFHTTKSAINVFADALDHYMSTMTLLMRSIVDRQAGGIHHGYPDVISKLFAELQITNLHEFYQTRVVHYNKRMNKKCEILTQRCQALAVPDLAPQLKLEDVPELHFPAALGEVFTPSLEPGFQMLHSLEQEELQGLELLDTVTQEDMKIGIVEYSQSETSPSLSPRNKKKRK